MMPGMADDARFIFHFLTKSAAMKLGFVGNSSWKQSHVPMGSVDVVVVYE